MYIVMIIQITWICRAIQCLAQEASRSSNITLLTTTFGKNLKHDRRNTNTVSEHNNLNQNILIYHIYLNGRRGFSPEIWRLNMQSHLKFAYKVLNWTMPNRIALNWTTQNQTKACITKSSPDIHQCFRTTYWPHLQRSTNQKERTEYSWRQMTQCFLGDLSVTYSFKETWHFRSRLCFCFQAQKHLTWLN